MRNSATALGMIGGILALIMGIISFGYTELTAQEQVRNLDFLPLPENPELLRAMSVIAPLLAIAGAGMARYRALWGGNSDWEKKELKMQSVCKEFLGCLTMSDRDR